MNELMEIENEFGLKENNEGRITTTSLKVAEYYGKEHKNVVAKIKSFIKIIPELAELNFKLSEYIDSTGRKLPMFEMDKQGFSMLVNKFTGDEATIFTYKYTKAFEQMEQIIKTKQNNQIALTSEVNNKIDKTLSDLSEYYRPTHKKKLDLNKHIKNCLGVNYTRENSDRVKEIALTLMGNYKIWEEVPIEILK